MKRRRSRLKRKPALSGGFFILGERDCDLKSLHFTNGKGFLQPLPAFCYRYRSCGRVTADAQREETTFIK